MQVRITGGHLPIITIWTCTLYHCHLQLRLVIFIFLYIFIRVWLSLMLRISNKFSFPMIWYPTSCNTSWPTVLIYPIKVLPVIRSEQKPPFLLPYRAMQSRVFLFNTCGNTIFGLLGRRHACPTAHPNRFTDILDTYWYEIMLLSLLPMVPCKPGTTGTR